mmetsp:Transcript_36355/g.59754  ORF Transcript_36355/g.59754 Transcript_36355/m.59754 type:complete len:128 (-) Transcript_36355:29-412(-)
MGEGHRHSAFLAHGGRPLPTGGPTSGGGRRFWGRAEGGRCHITSRGQNWGPGLALLVHIRGVPRRPSHWALVRLGPWCAMPQKGQFFCDDFLVLVLMPESKKWQHASCFLLDRRDCSVSTGCVYHCY